MQTQVNFSECPYAYSAITGDVRVVLLIYCKTKHLGTKFGV